MLLAITANINFVILAIVTGALLLAAMYHSVLFFHNRLRLIGYYALYLWSVFIYCITRCVFPIHVPGFSFFVTDEVLQMLTFIFYVRFSGIALELDKVKDKLAYRYTRVAPAVIIGYIVLFNTTNHMLVTYHQGRAVLAISYLAMRVFLLLGGFTSLIVAMRMRSDLYFKYFFYGNLCLIVGGLLSTAVGYLSIGHSYMINALSVLVVGYNVDVYFFSASISYKMSRETLDKEKAMRRVLEQEVEIQRNNAERIELSYKVKEEERSRIAAELHDEIGSTLSSISILSDVIIKEKNAASINAMQQDINDNSKLVMEKMDDIIWSLNPKNDSMEKMLLRIKQFATPVFEAKDINYRFDFNDNVLNVPLPIEMRQQVYLIIKEAINNLVKYAGCSTALVSAGYGEDELTFIVADDGKGFDAGAEFTGNGLPNMTQRAKDLGASLVIESNIGRGTTVTLRIKIV